jgi:hypothetical protein
MFSISNEQCFVFMTIVFRPLSFIYFYSFLSLLSYNWFIFFVFVCRLTPFVYCYLLNSNKAYVTYFQNIFLSSLSFSCFKYIMYIFDYFCLITYFLLVFFGSFPTFLNFFVWVRFNYIWNFFLFTLLSKDCLFVFPL